MVRCPEVLVAQDHGLHASLRLCQNLHSGVNDADLSRLCADHVLDWEHHLPLAQAQEATSAALDQVGSVVLLPEDRFMATAVSLVTSVPLGPSLCRV